VLSLRFAGWTFSVGHRQLQRGRHLSKSNDDQRLCGGHAWSLDGRQWTLAGTARFSTVPITDRGPCSFSRRERPHLVFADPKDEFASTALTSGVQFGAHPPTSVAGDDACYTLFRPVNGP